MTGIFEWIIAQKWAITPSALEAILGIVQRSDISVEDISRAMHGNEWERYTSLDATKISKLSLEGQQYPLLEGSRMTSQVKNVAILPVVGPIIPRASMFSRMSGSSSVDVLANEFNIAMASDEVDTIILNMDSPGGEITGIAEFSNMIYEARSTKKIVAYVYGMAASAGYWIASAASEIVASPTSESGSIGVVAVYSSSREADEKKGIKRIEIVSSQSPNKRPDIESNSGMSQIQKVVDDMANVFVASVARNRGLEPINVIEGYGRGGMFVGSVSIEAGLTDRLGSLEALIRENKQVTYSPFYIGGSMDLHEFQTKHTALFDQVKKMGADEASTGIEAKIASAKQEGVVEGITTENARIKAIETIDAPGAETIVAECKFNSTETKESVAVKVLEAQKEGRTKILNQVQADGTQLAQDLTNIVNPDEVTTASAEHDAIVAAGQKAMNQGR